LQIVANYLGSSDSITTMLNRWRGGDQAAAVEIYQRYEQRLVQLAERRIGNQMRPYLQPESIMLLVLESALGGIAAGRYAADKSGSLWGLLQTIADNKIRKRWEHLTAQKRDIRRAPQPRHNDRPTEPAAVSPPPEEAAILAEELDRIRSRLKPADFQILELQLEGLSNPEIAARLGCARQTVRYKAMRIEETLRRWADHDGTPPKSQAGKTDLHQ
jgi:RNA polymerase sigma-70 factor, ECF subfamily